MKKLMSFVLALVALFTCKVMLPSLESFYFSISSPRDLKKGLISGLSSPVKDLKSFIGSSDAPFSRNVFLNFMESSLSQTSPFFSKTEYR